MKKFLLWAVYKNSGQFIGDLEREKALDFFSDIRRSCWHFGATGSYFPDFHAYPLMENGRELREFEAVRATDFQKIEAEFFSKPVSPVFA